jgi:hypothetical protein
MHGQQNINNFPFTPEVPENIVNILVLYTFSGEKILSVPSFGREVKSFAPCRRFAAC